jgi:ABC-type antimicrobial peptide transport system permease subunit
MKLFHIAVQSLKHYFRSDFTIALGVMAATAVLTGALIVGDSMRQSLRSLTMERLGQIDEMLVSQGFFREKLADEIRRNKTFQSDYQKVTPLILFPGGTVEYQQEVGSSRAGQVNVLGVNDEFWSFDSSTLDVTAISGLEDETAIINQALADDLNISAKDVESGDAKITVRIPKQTQMPAESALGRKRDLIESLVDLKVVKVLPTEGLGRFSLHPSQSDPLNVYLPIPLLQDALGRSVLKHKSDPAQANVLLLSGKQGQLPSEEVTEKLRDTIRPTLEDYGLTLKRVTKKFGEGENSKTVFDYWSLSSDKMVLEDETVRSIKSAFPESTAVFTYLANDIRKPGTKLGIPFSMVSAVDFGDSFRPLSATSGDPIRELNDKEIVLNQWAADDLEVKPGDKIELLFFEPETTHGSQLERTETFTLVDIAAITEPVEPFDVPTRGPVKEAIFDKLPTIANDPDLTPVVQGVTDAQSIEDWDLPFRTDTLRSKDDDYWLNHRTTPKAFVSLAAGRKIWDSRFGTTTSFRLPISSADYDSESDYPADATGSYDLISKKLLDQFSSDDAQLGMHLVPIKRRGLAASSGSTPFDALFLALSMFVIGSALILVSLLFRLGLQQRASEVGLLKAAGFNQKRIRNLWLQEMLVVCLIGAFLGVFLGIGYAWLMIKGLTTWWVGAISRPFLTMHASPLSLIIGFISGILICVLTILWSLRRTKKQTIRGLLSGQLESSVGKSDRTKRSWSGWVIPLLFVGAVGLAVMATGLAGEAQAGAFMGAGFLALAALLMCVYVWLKRPASGLENQLSLSRLAFVSAQRNPLRSTLTIGLVAVASFLIAAVSAFRLAPNEAGTAGFDWVAQSSQPVFQDLATEKGQGEALGIDFKLSPETKVVPIRFKPGEDASCNNLYQSTQPRALGVPPSFIERFDDENATQFAWGGAVSSDSESAKANPWHLLDGNGHSGTKEDPIPVIIDKNTANYSLKIYLPGTVREVRYDTGETFYFRAVGFLANTILQGSLIMSETDFQSVFPTTAGYRYFLIDDASLVRSGDSQELVSEDVAKLEDRLGDQGFDARSADKLLANFMAVQNTYLSTFQTLGALGLLLGTFGLAAVQVRSVLERTKELGLMRAVGFANRKLSWMVLLENAWLLLLGLAVGIGAALFTTVPHWLVGSASVPWATLGVMFATIVLVGLVAAWLASRNISRLPLLESLRTSS